MAKRVLAIVRPDLLVWARQSAGLSVEDAAKKVPTKPERLEQWEIGERRPTLNQLRKLAVAYKRPLAVFYLPKAPKDFSPMRDFRSLPLQTSRVESPQLRMAIRSSRNRREIAIDLYKALREKPPEFQYRAALDNDPDKIAIEIRNFLNITQKIQSDFKTDYEALNWWRSALESQGILVFQASGVEVSEMRGFSISEGPLPAIVANIKDSPLARIFTLIHELVHIMLNDGGLCDLAETEHYHPDDEQIEIFSNRIAGAVLVPEGDLRTDKLVREKGREIWWTDNEISELANKFKVSREVLVRRLLICNLTTAEFYQQKRGELQVVKKTQGGFVPPYRKAISVSGAPFIRLVLANYYQENITSSDLSEFLDVKLQHVQKIEEEFMGRTIEFGAIP